MNLEIGGLRCHLKVKSKRWEAFLRSKYAFFVTNSNTKPVFGISVIARQKSNFYLGFKPQFKEAMVYVPLNLRKFRTFDFFLKTAVATLFLNHRGFFLHSSALIKDGQGLIFAAKQKVGKSTVVKLMSEYQPLNDDFTIIRKVKGEFFVFSSPFYETNPVPKGKIGFPVGRVYFLVQAKKNKVRKLTRSEIVLRLMSLVLVPKFTLFLSPRQSKKILEKMVVIAQDFAKQIPGFMLHFKKDRSFLKYIE